MFNKSYGTPFGGNTGGFGTTSTFGQNTGFGTTSGGAFGTSAFGSNNNAGGLFGSTQTKPGGLFGASTFSQPATSSTSTGFGFGTSTGTSSSLFGTTSTGGGLFSNQSNAFAQNKPVGFGNFGTSTSSGGLFGTTNTTSNPFGGTSGSLFGSTSFSTVPTGTTIKFNELRLEDYQANRKGPTNPVGAGATPGLFGSSTATSSTATGLFGSTTNTGFSYGANKTPFGTSKYWLWDDQWRSLWASGSNNNAGGLFGSTQTKPGGLFGASTFSQPATSSTSTGFGFGTSTGTSSSLFGTASTGGGLFSNQSNAFAQNKPVGFGNFGTSTSSGGLFGTTNTTSNPFGGTSGSLFGSTSFSTVPTGTTIKFNELRLEDYQANRKGPTNPVGAGATGLVWIAHCYAQHSHRTLRPPPTRDFHTGQIKHRTTGFGTGTGGLFSSTQPTPNLFNKPFGQPTTAPNTGFSFTNTSTLGQPNTNTMGLFGAAQPTQTGGLFGTAANTNTAAAFGTGTGLFGQPNAGFGVGGSSLFSNKTAGFGTTTTSAPSFGTTTTGLFGYNANTTGNSLFGNKPATGVLGPGLGAGFGTALNPGQNSLFGSTQPKLGGTLGTGAFGAPGFNTSTATLGFGAPQPATPTLLCPAGSPAAAPQQLDHCLFSGLALFRNPINAAASKALQTGAPPNPTSLTGLFGAAQPTQTGGLFGTAANTNTAAAFGTGTGLFGQPNAGFGVGGSKTGLGSSRREAQDTSQRPGQSPGKATNPPSLLGYNANTTGNSLFGNKPATGVLGPGLGAGFGTEFTLWQHAAQARGTPDGAFGAPGFNTSTATLGFGAPQPAVALTDPNVSAAQQAVLQQHLNSLTYSPFGDSPLFRNPMSDPKKKEERLKPTNPAAQKALTTPTHYKLTPRPATRNLNSSSLFSPTSAEVDDLASPSIYPENGDRSVSENHRQDEEQEDESYSREMSRFLAIAKPLPQTPENALHKHHNSSVDDTLLALNVRPALRNGLENSLEDASYHEENRPDTRGLLHHPLPGGTSQNDQ
ncbi:hypothetical protein E2320_005692 [Naja naja]|nr:hypothetical protein E2320_005692 [Naja naja]